MTKAKGKLYIKTFGCQMNVYDSERMGEALAGAGYVSTDTPESADLVILNTCHIREKAAEKVYSELGRLKKIKTAREKDGHGTTIAVAGCVAQAEGREILARAPVVDLVVGPQSYHRMGDLISRTGQEREGIIDIDFPEDDKFKHLPARPVASRAPAPSSPCRRGATSSAHSAWCPIRAVANIRAPFARSLKKQSGWRKRACERSHSWDRM